jgi:hypothetical protein
MIGNRADSQPVDAITPIPVMEQSNNRTVSLNVEYL